MSSSIEAEQNDNSKKNRKIPTPSQKKLINSLHFHHFESVKEKFRKLDLPKKSNSTLQFVQTTLYLR